MRRRVLFIGLWLLGTLTATTVVFAAVGSLSADLGEVNNPKDSFSAGGSRAGNPGGSPTTTAALEPFITTTAPPETTTTIEVATTTTIEIVEPTTQAPGDVPPRTVATPPSPGTTQDRSVATTATPRTIPPVITVVQPPETTAPPPPTTPTTASPPPTAPATTRPAPGACVTKPRPVAGRNALSYQACQDGAHLVGVVASPGWTYTVIASGPPTVSVTFTNGSTSVTCTLRSGGDGSIDTSDC